MADLRVLVAGAGALGSVFGGFLRKAGFEVVLLGRPAHMAAIERGGLAIDGLWGEHRVDGLRTATDAAALAGPFDCILVSVKSYDTADMAAAVVHLLAPHGVMISLQNGLGNVETIESIAGAERTLGARVIFGAAVPQPGLVRITVFADPTAIGALRPGLVARCDEAARRWASIIDAAGVPALYTARLPGLLWAKVFYNAALNPLGALLRVHYGALSQREDSRAIMQAAIEEAFAVAAAEGVELPWDHPLDYLREFYGRLVPATFDHRSSMLQDLERGRRTEVDAINGAVWHRGRSRGIVAPVNETLTRILHLVELVERERSGPRA